MVPKSVIRWLLTSTVLVIGFADLWRGGITLGPVLLILAYCGLIPWILYTPAPRAAPERVPADGHRPSYGAAAVAGIAVLALYVVTLAPTTAMWDTSEYIAAAYTLGNPHPPGNPFFVLLGRVFTILPIAPSVAQRVNLLAALSSAGAAGIWFLVTERVLWRWFAERWTRLLGASVATLIGATAFTVWNQSVVNEKVYTIALLFTAIASWLALRWLDQPEGSKADRRLVLIAYLLGLGYANHMAGFLAMPAVGLALILRRPATFLRWRLLLAGAAALVLGLTPFAVQPIRAAHFPPINEGEVTACTDGPKLACTFSQLTWERFLYNFNRKQFGKPSLIDRQAPFTAQLGMWWLYFKWQWLRDLSGTRAPLQNTLAVLFLGLGLLGASVHWQKDQRTFWYLAPLLFSMTMALVFYMNFRYGFSQARPGSANAEVRDRDYFFIWSFSAWGIWAGMGLMWCWDQVRAFVADIRPRLAPALSAPVLALALVPFWNNWPVASRAGETFTRDWAVDLLNSVEPYGILITGGDDDTFPLWYAQEVEGVRRDVLVAVTSLMQLDWYGRQLIRRPIYEYDAARGPVIYRDRVWSRPDRPIVSLSLEEADRLPPYAELQGPGTFRKDGITATISQRFLTRDEILLLQMIKDTFPQRGIFISRGAGSYGNQLGLEPYLVTQGFVRKLSPAPLRASADTLAVPGVGWFDFKRTEALWTQVYRAQDSLIRQGRWVDPASSSIPFTYLYISAALGQVLEYKGRRTEAAKMLETTRAIARAGGLEGALVPVEPPADSPKS
ncbi:MAG: DUF2723 domain-containing protein [Gemmatimonadetes bacterium]|nr:DUF2723 domain-containing protein [Gemmatimonadota bacterium]